MGTWESTHMIASISICITNAKTARRRSQYTVMASYVRQYPWVRSMELLRIHLDTHLIPSSTSFHLQYSTRFSRIHIIQVHVLSTVDQPPFKLSQLASPLRVDPRFMMGQIGRSLEFVTEPWDRLREKKLCRSDAKAASVSEIVLMINLSDLLLTSVAVPHTAPSLPLVRRIL
jgi:hypothetical protein